jgi:fucose 4-O-acetylase-like acetyltransferase
MNRVIYGFHMPLFMFISGYVYRATWRPTGMQRLSGKNLIA